MSKEFKVGDKVRVVSYSNLESGKNDYPMVVSEMYKFADKEYVINSVVESINMPKTYILEDYEERFEWNADWLIPIEEIRPKQLTLSELDLYQDGKKYEILRGEGYKSKLYCIVYDGNLFLIDGEEELEELLEDYDNQKYIPSTYTALVEEYSLLELLQFKFTELEEKQKVDWTKVPMDTKVIVWDDSDYTYKAYFSHYNEETDTFYAFADGATSWSNQGNAPIWWEHYRLANEND